MTFRIDWERLYHGICPECREYKFLGHGPLCGDCLAATTPTTDQPEESHE